MAIFRLEGKVISRGKGDRSVVAASAYRCGSKLFDERKGKAHDYAHKTDAYHTVILAPEGAPDWALNPETLWNEVEKSERRRDAQLARDLLLSLPRELSRQQQIELTTAWVSEELVKMGMVVQVSFHDDGQGNPHAHLMATLRRLDGNEFSSKKERGWNDQGLISFWRESWCKAENRALETAGRPERVDHRSLAARGIDREPEPKIGFIAMAMKKRGIDPERMQLVRFVRSLNFMKPLLRGLAKFGEVQQFGLGASWWERSLIFTSEKGRAVRESVADKWAKFLGNRRAHGPEIPGPDHGPDMSR